MGTPRFGTNTSGTQVWSWSGDAFGVGSTSGTATVNLRMPGQYFDDESDLFYNWNRYYNPEIGRYISSDPIGLDGGPNTFLYANASPVMYTDPEGLVAPAVAVWLSRAGYSAVQAYRASRVAVSTKAAAELSTAARVSGSVRATHTSKIGFGVGGGVLASRPQMPPASCPVPKTTAHGAERIAGANATRGGVLNVKRIAEVRLTGKKLTQADGASVSVLESSAGRFDVVISSERGIITTFKNLSEKSLNRLARNYGWR